MNFEKIGSDIGKLVTEKNTSYGDSFKNSGEIFKFLFPDGIPPEKYTIALALVRILDKVFRLATNPNYNNENCWQDIAGYAILMLGYEKGKDEKKMVETTIGNYNWTKVLDRIGDSVNIDEMSDNRDIIR